MSIDRVDAAGLTDAGFAAIQDRIDAGVDGYGNLQTRADARALAAEVVRLRTARDEAEAKVARLRDSLAEACAALSTTPAELHDRAARAVRAVQERQPAIRAALAVTSPPSEPR